MLVESDWCRKPVVVTELVEREWSCQAAESLRAKVRERRFGRLAAWRRPSAERPASMFVGYAPITDGGIDHGPHSMNQVANVSTNGVCWTGLSGTPHCAGRLVQLAGPSGRHRVEAERQAGCAG